MQILFSRHLMVASVACGLWLAGSAIAQAGLLKYTETTAGTITGTLNGVAFTGKTLSMTQTGDTSNIVYGSIPAGGVSTYDSYTLSGTVSITIDGLGTTSFTSPSDFRATSLAFAVSGTPLLSAVGFGDWSGGLSHGLGIGTVSFNDLSAPFSVTDPSNSGFATGTYHTSAGDLVITDSNGGSTTFTAEPVPEPSSLALGAIGAGLAVFVARRRRSSFKVL